METYRNEMTERILNLTLEIIYLLTEEDYIVVKKSCEHLTPNSCHLVCGGLSRTQSPITVPPPHSLKNDRDNDQKILELTNKIIQLLTGEVPIRCEDVAVYFSMEEREYIEGHTDLYKDVMMKNLRPLTSLGVSEDEAASHTKCSSLESKYTDIRVNRNFFSDTDMYTPTDNTQYTSTPIKEESVSCDGGDLTHTDMYTPTGHTQYTSTHIKEESVSCDGGELADCASYKSSDHTITSGHTDCEIKQNNSLVTENIKLDEPVEIIHQTSPTVSNSYNTSSSPKCILTERMLEKFMFLKLCFIPTHPGHKSGDIVQKPNVGFEKKKTFGDISNLTKYWRAKSKRKTPQCSECGEYFLRNALLIAHQKTHTGQKPFECSKCGKYFQTNSELVIHQRSHTGEKPFQCSQFGKGFAEKRVLVNQVGHSETKTFGCSDCGKGFTEEWRLVSHQVTHTKEKSFKSSECEKQFSERWRLVSHQRTHTGEKPFQCSKCGRWFAERGALGMHMKTHTVIKKHTCPECGKHFREKFTLVVHQRTHTGERPFQCSDCGDRFADKRRLLRHQRIHTGDKCTCPECGKDFRTKSSLAKHLRSHTREKPYVCTRCGKCYRYKSLLVRHERVHEGERSLLGSKREDRFGDSSKVKNKSS